MKKVVLFVGGSQVPFVKPIFEDAFKRWGFQTIHVGTFDAAVEVIKRQHVSIVVFYAYRDIFSKPIDMYQGKLPPVIYWYIPNIDKVPKRKGVRCVDEGTTLLEVLNAANEMLSQKE